MIKASRGKIPMIDATISTTNNQVKANPERIVPLIKEQNKDSNFAGLKQKTTDIILLSTENGITELVRNLKERDLSTSGINNITSEELSHLPNSAVGIMIYYFLEGIKRDFNITFDDTPKSVRGRGGNKNKLGERTRILTKKMKQDIVDGTTMEFYKKDIDNGMLTLPEVLQKIQKAYELKSHLEKCGLILSSKKTDGVMYQGIDYTDENTTSSEEVEEIIKKVNEKVGELVNLGVIQLPKQERKANDAF